MKKKKKITLVIAGISFSIFLMHLFNKLIFFLSTLKEKLFSENSNYYNWRFGKIFFTKKGTGSPILLIHDLDSTSSDYEWREIIQGLSEEHTVYTLDLLGCGRSEKPKMTYTTYLYVQLISDFIKNVIKHKTDVIATGKSTAFVTMACYIDSQLFNRLLFVNPEELSILNKYPKYKHKILKYILDVPIFGTFLYNIIVGKHMIRSSFNNKYYASPSNVKQREILAYHEAAHLGGSSSKYLYASIRCHYMNTNIVHAVKELNNSIYIIAGDKLEETERVIEEYMELNPSIETIKLENVKYLPQLEAPELFLSTCEIFLH